MGKHFKRKGTDALEPETILDAGGSPTPIVKTFRDSGELPEGKETLPAIVIDDVGEFLRQPGGMIELARKDLEDLEIADRLVQSYLNSFAEDKAAKQTTAMNLLVRIKAEKRLQRDSFQKLTVPGHGEIGIIGRMEIMERQREAEKASG